MAAEKSNRNKNIISINPMQDDLEEAGLGAAEVALSRMGRPVQAVKEGSKKVGEVLNKIHEKIAASARKSPKKTFAKMGAGVEGTKQLKRALLDEEASTETEGSFRKGGLVKKGKPKLAKKGWR
jgi:hypothetical protein